MSVVVILTPGAVISGNVFDASPQAEGPRLESLASASVEVVEPTAKAPGLFAGLALFERKLPAANTGTIPAARRAWMSWANSRLQPPEANVHELLTTCGASAVAGSPSGSSSHWNARWVLLVRLWPASLKIRAAIQRAPGATPIDVPPALPPTITPITWVPWPLMSVGAAGC